MSSTIILWNKPSKNKSISTTSSIGSIWYELARSRKRILWVELWRKRVRPPIAGGGNGSLGSPGLRRSGGSTPVDLISRSAARKGPSTPLEATICQWFRFHRTSLFPLGLPKNLSCNPRYPFLLIELTEWSKVGEGKILKRMRSTKGKKE